jgi:hypothetical protein
VEKRWRWTSLSRRGFCALSQAAERVRSRTSGARDFMASLLIQSSYETAGVCAMKKLT